MQGMYVTVIIFCLRVVSHWVLMRVCIKTNMCGVGCAVVWAGWYVVWGNGSLRTWFASPASRPSPFPCTSSPQPRIVQAL